MEISVRHNPFLYSLRLSPVTVVFHFVQKVRLINPFSLPRAFIHSCVHSAAASLGHKEATSSALMLSKSSKDIMPTSRFITKTWENLIALWGDVGKFSMVENLNYW